MDGVPHCKLADGARRWSEVRSTARPFDLMLFRGPEFVSRSIMWCQRAHLHRRGAGAFSHAGLVISRAVYDDERLVPGELYLLESTMSGRLSSDRVRNIDGDWSFLGVQIRRLDDVVRHYDASSPDARVALLRLKRDVSTSPDSLRIYSRVIRAVEGRPYDGNPLDLLAALLPVLRPLRFLSHRTVRCGAAEADSDRWLFCSELAALVLKRCGLLDATVNERNVLPVDFLPGVDEDSRATGSIYGAPQYVYAST